jgi:hypothetical protein
MHRFGEARGAQGRCSQGTGDGRYPVWGGLSGATEGKRADLFYSSEIMYLAGCAGR